MTTVRSLCEQALKKIRIVGMGETMPSDYAADALDVFNAMLQKWVTVGVNCSPVTFALSDTWAVFCPHEDTLGATMSALSYQGTWNASTNSPALSTGVGTQGYLYKVSVAGTSSLDTVATWAINDYVIFNGDKWLKGTDCNLHLANVITMLAWELLDPFGKEPSQTLARDRSMAWNAICADWIKIDNAKFDNSIVMTPTRRYYGIIGNNT